MEEPRNIRAFILPTLLFSGAALLLAYAFFLQVIDTGFKSRAESTTINREIVYPSRGLVVDRNDELLIYNEPVYDILVTFNQLPDDLDIEKLCTILKLDRSEYEDRINKNWSSGRYSKNVPFTFLKKVPANIFNVFQENMAEFTGFSYRLRNVRAYPHQNAAHVLGYIGEVNSDEITEDQSIYEIGDYKGVTGLETEYEDVLRGVKGANFILKDNIGRSVGFYNEGRLNLSPTAGADIQISLDIKLQQYGEELMDGLRGSIVALEPNTGEILAMVSAPNYDPNVLRVDRDRGAAYTAISQDSLQPFFNRSLSAKYPPGSIFKPVLSLIGLQEGVISADRYISCTGRYKYRLASWGCHAGAGRRNLKKAIEQSCNTYFYTVYRELVEQYGFDKPEFGLDKVGNYLEQFGLGQPLGVDLPSEESGFNPKSDYYDELYKNSDGEWRSTYIISNGIGQGEIELTTVQMANLAAIMANKGYYYVPHILKELQGTNQPTPQFEKKEIGIDKIHFDPVIEGMISAVKNSTAGLCAVPGVTIAGKTGTSENVHGEDHSVFYAFAPAENPKIAIAVYVENVGWGATYAAPIAGLMIEQYLNKNIAPTRNWVENYIHNKKNIP